MFHKLTIATLVSVLVLIFVGAIVRVTGAGMGCPDWPTCWGLLIPPTKVEDVDFAKLEINKFQAKAARMGRDPKSISHESLRAEFNPRHVWTEFINRMFSLPVGFFSIAAFVASFRLRSRRTLFISLSFISLLLVLANAWMGARVVYSGIAPGVLSSHLALAMALICVLTYSAWASADKHFYITMRSHSGWLKGLILFLLILVVAEGIMGTQVREITGEMAKAHLDLPKESWIHELEENWVYIVHRSFSWLLVVVTAKAFFLTRKHQSSPFHFSQIGVVSIIAIQMLLGLIMAQIHIYSWVQVLHVGLAGILLSLVFHWFLILPSKRSSP
jgi:heme a synthase